MRHDKTINQKDLANSIFEIGNLLEEIDKNKLKKLASSWEGERLLEGLVRAYEKGILNKEQIIRLLKAALRYPKEFIYYSTDTLNQRLQGKIPSPSDSKYEIIRTLLTDEVNRLIDIFSSPKIEKFVKKDVKKIFGRRLSKKIIETFGRGVASSITAEKLIDLLNKDYSRKILKTLKSKKPEIVPYFIDSLLHILNGEWARKMYIFDECLKSGLLCGEWYVTNYMKMLEEAGYEPSERVILEVFLTEQLLDSLLRHLAKYKNSRYFVNLIEKVFITGGLTSLEIEEAEPYVNFLISSPLERMFKEMDLLALEILSFFAIELIMYYRKDGVDIANDIIRILLSYKNLKTDEAFYCIANILDYARKKETCKKLLQVVETYARIDGDRTIEILDNIHRNLKYQFRKKREEMERTYGHLGYRILYEEIDKYLSRLLDSYLKEVS